MNETSSAFAQVLRHGDPQWRPREAARMLASAGVPVFPVAPNGKKPLTRQGFHDASLDAAQIDAWWAATPRANLAVPTGARSGISVVDVDLHGAVDGYVALNNAHDRGLVDGWELAVRSPSGGLHLYFAADTSSEQRSWQAARAGIDFRGDGGYIVVPPSSRMVDGKRVAYTVADVNDGPHMALDSARLRDFLDPGPAAPRRAPGSFGQQPLADVERLAAWVARRQEGERNHGLFWAACKMAERDVTPATALGALASAGEQIGLTTREVSTTVRSAYRSVLGATTAPDSSPTHPPPYRAATQHRGRAL